MSSIAPATLLFVYGTLKRGCSNHGQLSGGALVGTARTPPGYRLYDLGGYPALAAHPHDAEGVAGEVWSVAPDLLARLDAFEGVHEGLYRRELLPLLPPFADREVFAYLPAQGVAGRSEIGGTWTE
jgi:gamma-glutamylcyclotransferase (GGCT)/AIG2-like uncharacterized protein YtfP